MKKLGLIVNPIAGMGGKVGLKGTDGPEVLDMALSRGAEPHSPARAIQALAEIRPSENDICLVTFPGLMGEQEALAADFAPQVLLNDKIGDKTSRMDTLVAAKKLLEEQVDLVLFAGGDGTARDIYEAMQDEALVLGIPAGVKIHSSVFASSPEKAGKLADLFLKGRTVREKLAEVMDIDEVAFRKGTVKTRLFGYLKIPYEKKHIQNLKAGSPASEAESQTDIALEFIKNIEKETLYLIGPGSTTRTVMRCMNLSGTLLGIDAIFNGECIGHDLKEEDILKLLEQYSNVKIVITPIGGQGFLFGRGNQQFSSSVISRIGKENIIVICTSHKLHALKGEPLLVDTGDKSLNQRLSGFIRIITGYKEKVIYKVMP